MIQWPKNAYRELFEAIIVEKSDNLGNRALKFILKDGLNDIGLDLRHKPESESVKRLFKRCGNASGKKYC